MRFRRPRVESALSALNAGSLHQRVRALKDLRALGPKAGSAALEVARCLETTDAEVRDAAMSAALAIGKAAVPGLLEVAQARSYAVRSNAVRVLAAMGPTVAPLVAETYLISSDKSERDVAETILRRLGATAANELARRLDGDLGRARQAIAAMTRLGSAGEPALVRALNHPSPQVRVLVASALRSVEKPSDPMIAALARCLGDPNGHTRQTAAQTLVSFGAASVPMLVRCLAESDLAREAATDALVQIGEAALASLLECLAGEDEARRQAAVGPLERFGHAAAPGLLAALGHPDPRVRVAAARTLGATRGEGASSIVEALAATLGDPSRPVRVTAIAALSRFGSRAAAARHELLNAMQTEDSAAGILAGVAVARSGPDAVDPLLALLRSSDSRVRLRAAASLVELAPGGRAAATSGLIAALRDSTGPVRAAAALSLGLLRAAGAAPALATTLRDPDLPVRSAAAEALAAMGSAAVPILATGLRDPDPDVRTRAVRALGRLGEDGVAELVHGLGDADPLVRAWTEATLWSLGATTRPVLERALAGSSRDLRERLSALLSAIEQKSNGREMSPVAATGAPTCVPS